MDTVATKNQVRAAACAIAAVTAFTPAAVAQADSFSAPSLPAAPVSEIIDIVPLGPAHFSLDGIAAAPNWWWLGGNSDNQVAAAPSAPTVIFDVQLINYVPRFLRPLFGWFTRNLNFSVCFAGVSVRLGPYGRITASVGRTC